MSDYLLISADSHFVEPPGMWAERVDRKFRDRAPHTVKGLKEKRASISFARTSNRAVAGFFGAGVPSQELPEHNKKGFDEAPKACTIRLNASRIRIGTVFSGSDLHLDGDAAVRPRRRRIPCRLFPRLQRLGRRVLQLRPQAPDPLGLITLEDIPAAVAELERIAKKGMAGAMIWAEPPADHPYSLQNTTRSGPPRRT